MTCLTTKNTQEQCDMNSDNELQVQASKFPRAQLTLWLMGVD